MRFIRRLAMIVLFTGVGLYLLLCAALFAFQRSLIYYPQPRSSRDASSLTSLQVETATVHISMRAHAGPAAMIYFGGNAEDVSREVPILADTFPDRAIYALHYPGYGGSSGSPSQRTIFSAAMALFDRVREEHPNVVVVGRSLGSGVAVWVASQRPVYRLILVTPFDGLGDVASAQYPFLPVRLLLRDRFESWRYAPKVTAPTRIIVAEDDKLVPRSSSDRLRTRFHEGLVSYIVLPNVGHNTIQESPNYLTLLNTEQAKSLSAP